MSPCFFFFFAVDHRIVLTVEEARGHLSSNSSCRGRSKLEVYLSPSIDARYQLNYCLEEEESSLGPFDSERYGVRDGAISETSPGFQSQELVSSDSKVVLRFWSPDGTFPSRAFRAKYKIENIQFEHQSRGIDLGHLSAEEAEEFSRYGHY